MAILGDEGRILLKREPLSPAELAQEAASPNNSFYFGDQTYWPGDEILLSGDKGLPLAADSVDGGTANYYGGNLLLGPNRIHITAPNDNFYANDAADFYADYNPVYSAKYFIYRDQLDRISFYTTRRDALNGNPANRVQFLALDFGALKIEPVEPEFQSLCLLKEWSLSLDAPSIDTTVVGVKFGEAVKSLVTAGGSADFFVDRVSHSDSTTDPTYLMRLLLLTEKGSKASAQFWMIRDRPAGDCQGLLPGDLYYAADILITNIAISLRVDDVITGSMTFVSTGRVELKEGV